jgi:ATP-dependent DNA helicase RecG
VLHDLHLAEAKGTGIRAMRRLATDAGLQLPEIHSDRQANEFRLTLFLHNLLTEEEHVWLREIAPGGLNAEDAKVLVFARENGSVDNAACRDFCGLDTLAASLVLRRLRDRGLLIKQGGGSRTYYVLAADMPTETSRDDHEQPSLLDFMLPDEIPPSSLSDTPGDSRPSMVGFAESPHASDKIPPCSAPNAPDGNREEGPRIVDFPQIDGVPPELQGRILAAGTKPRQAVVRELVLALCALRPFTAVELCKALSRSDPKELRRTYLRPMRDEGLLALLYPETEMHPNQAYKSVKKQDDEGHGQHD